MITLEKKNNNWYILSNSMYRMGLSLQDVKEIYDLLSMDKQQRT